jgi:glycosyltransferase involved in cell wall biosynthesis
VLPLQFERAFIDRLHIPYRHVHSVGYDLPQSLVNVWVSCGPYFQLAHDIETDAGANALVYWWLVTGRLRFPGIGGSIDRHLLTTLHSIHLPRATPTALQTQPDKSALDYFPETAACGTHPLTPLLTIVWNNRPDLQKTFDIHTPEGSAAFWQWWTNDGSKEYFARTAVAIEKVRVSKPPNIETASKPSVCLVGYPEGEFGLGEDIRQLRASLRSIGIEPTVVVAPWTISARQDTSEQFVESDLSVFDADIAFFVMPAFDTMTLLNKIGATAFTARRRIGFWQWELDRFPTQSLFAFNLVDEIWCHSEHAARSLRGATATPVHKVPLPVSVPEPKATSRSRFGIPDDAFVFFTSFDGSSYIARKNPLGTILAFQEAFPRGATELNVSLIVKAMNTNNDPLWRECLRKTANDRRITIIDNVLDHSEYYELMRNCDAVISLHRAEGFGRLMAEAMAMGIPVIASRYSGNLDFMTDDNSWLIDGDLVPILPGDYPFHHGQNWLEPSIREAAGALRECATDEAKRRRLAAAGKRDILTRHDPAFCGATYAEFLRSTPAESRLHAAADRDGSRIATLP